MARTQLNKNQEANDAVSLQGIPIDSTAPTTGQVLGFTGTQWAPTAATGSNIAQSSLAPTTDETIGVNKSAIVPRQYTITSGKKLIVSTGAIMKIL